MKIANISYAKNHLSKLIGMVREGETVLILDRKKPVARMEPVGADSGTGESWVDDVVRRGILTRPAKPLDVKRILSRKLLKTKHGGDVVQAVIKDREEGR